MTEIRELRTVYSSDANGLLKALKDIFGGATLAEQAMQTLKETVESTTKALDQRAQAVMDGFAAKLDRLGNAGLEAATKTLGMSRDMVAGLQSVQTELKATGAASTHLQQVNAASTAAIKLAETQQSAARKQAAADARAAAQAKMQADREAAAAAKAAADATVKAERDAAQAAKESAKAAQQASQQQVAAMQAIRQSANNTLASWWRAGSSAIDAAGRAALVATTSFLGLGTAVGVTGFNFLQMRERTTRAFEGVLKDGAAARALFREIVTEAERTPFEVDQLAPLAQKLLSIGTNAAQVVPTIRILADEITLLGKGEPELNRVVTALGQIRAKGRLQGEELLQLNEAGVRPLEDLANALGVRTDEVFKLIESGAVRAEVAISAILSGMEARSKGAAASMSQDMGGLWSTVMDKAKQAAATMFEPAQTAAKGWLQSIIAGADSGAALQFTSRIRDSIQAVTDAIGRLLQANGGAILQRIADGIVNVSKGIAGMVDWLSKGSGPWQETLSYWGQFLARIAEFLAKHPELVAMLALFQVGKFLGFTQVLMEIGKALLVSAGSLLTFFQHAGKAATATDAVTTAVGGLGNALRSIALVAAVAVIAELAQNLYDAATDADRLAKALKGIKEADAQFDKMRWERHQNEMKEIEGAKDRNDKPMPDAWKLARYERKAAPLERDKVLLDKQVALEEERRQLKAENIAFNLNHDDRGPEKVKKWLSNIDRLEELGPGLSDQEFGALKTSAKSVTAILAETRAAQTKIRDDENLRAEGARTAATKAEEERVDTWARERGAVQSTIRENELSRMGSGLTGFGDMRKFMDLPSVQGADVTRFAKGFDAPAGAAEQLGMRFEALQGAGLATQAALDELTKSFLEAVKAKKDADAEAAKQDEAAARDQQKRAELDDETRATTGQRVVDISKQVGEARAEPLAERLVNLLNQLQSGQIGIDDFQRGRKAVDVAADGQVDFQKMIGENQDVLAPEVIQLAEENFAKLNQELLEGKIAPETYKEQLQQMNDQLKEVSDKQKVVNKVQGDARKRLEEITQKTWISNEGWQQFTGSMQQLTDKFRDGKLSAEEYREAVEQLTKQMQAGAAGPGNAQQNPFAQQIVQLIWQGKPVPQQLLQAAVDWQKQQNKMKELIDNVNNWINQEVQGQMQGQGMEQFVQAMTSPAIMPGLINGLKEMAGAVGNTLKPLNQFTNSLRDQAMLQSVGGMQGVYERLGRIGEFLNTWQAQRGNLERRIQDAQQNAKYFSDNYQQRQRFEDEVASLTQELALLDQQIQRSQPFAGQLFETNRGGDITQDITFNLPNVTNYSREQITEFVDILEQELRRRGQSFSQPGGIR